MSDRGDRLTVHIDNMLSTQPSIDARSKPKIFKVDPKLRMVNIVSVYEPQRVAIGPIHRGKDHLKDFEQYKVIYLQQLLKRRGEHSAKRYVVEMMNVEEEARKCYSNSIQLPEGDAFVEMLLLDGVFVIEYLRKRWFSGLTDENDHIFQSSQVRYALRSDLVLMENQLPFMVLSQLFRMTKLDHPQDNLHYLILRNIEMERSMPLQQDFEGTHIHSTVHIVDDHLLGLVYETYISHEHTKGNKRYSVPKHTASELAEAGVEFKTAKEINLMNISFADGVLQLPKLHVDDIGETMLSNLVAYEQMTNTNLQTYMSDYIDLMSSLVKSAKDVGILRHSGVIENWLEDDEAIHLMISKLDKNIVVGFFYADIYKSLNDHCRRRRNKWIANLKRNYFNTPWAIMSVIAAIILLLLTAIQTVFTIIG